ncbi:MAG: SRPBCC domain-containing protein [Candidatus Micrarchaeota archaeon]|nr:SRPBCC domain-containing protein [Candidatus Micrarchaeota archaeon]
MADNKRELVITRVFDAPRELVWRAWTDPKILKRWWGPRGVTNPTCEWEATPGGKIDIVMLAGKELGSFAGQKWPMEGTFREVTPQSRLVFTSNALDDIKDMMIESQVTVDFDAMGSKTKMRLHILVTNSTQKAEAALQGMEMGWSQSIDKLAEELAKG